MPEVLYEDNHIIAVFKPAGLLVQGDVSGDRSLMDEVKEYLKEKYNKPGNVFLGLVHRIDRNVSGIVLFAKTSKGASRLSEQFREDTIQKTYHAVIENKIEPASGTLVHYLKKDENKRRASVSLNPEPGYDRSELSYKTISHSNGYSLLEINLITGRFHQIRAQFSTIGHPLVGDTKYGSTQRLADGSIALCATQIKFKTATTDELIHLKVENPPEWNVLLK